MSEDEQPKRNPDPTPEQVFAMIFYAQEYDVFSGGPKLFWASLDAERRRTCEESANKIIRAWRKRQPKASRL